ncbi:MAG: MFS transporter [Candidatus Hermodarchaeota archaeon]
MISDPPIEKQTSFLMLPFQHREYAKLWLAQLVNNVGNQFTYLALQFLVYSLTQSTFAMGVLAIFQTIPMIIIGPYAGVLVDRYDRKMIMSLSNLVQAFWLFCIPLTGILLGVESSARVLLIFPLAFLMGAVNRFFFPSRGASIPKLVPKEDLLAANSLSAATYQLSALVGPVTAGVFVALFNYDMAFYIDMLGFLISAVFIIGIRTNLRPEKLDKPTSLTIKADLQPLKKSNAIISDLGEAYRFLKGYPAFGYIFILFAFLLFGFGASIVLMVPYLTILIEDSALFDPRASFGIIRFFITLLGLTMTPELVFGILSALAALMGLIMALTIGKRRDLPRPLTLMNLACFFAALIMFGFAFAPGVKFYTKSMEPVDILAIFWAFFGLIQVFVMIPYQTLAQETVPDALRGKLFSFFNIVITVAQISGMAMGGILSEITDIPTTCFFGGLVIIVASIIGFLVLIWKNYEKDVKERREAFRTQAPLSTMISSDDPKKDLVIDV